MAGLVGASATGRSAAESAAASAGEEIRRRLPASRIAERGSSSDARASRRAPIPAPRLVSVITAALSRSTLSGASRSPARIPPSPARCRPD